MADKIEKKEIGKNCTECKKALKKSKRYYREGSYYCNNNCYRKNADKKAEEAAQAAKEAEQNQAQEQAVT